MLANWIVPDSGTVMLDGIDLKNRMAVVGKVGFIPEVPNLFDFFSVEYNLKLFAALSRTPFSRVEEILDEFNLLPFRKSKVLALSKGLKQRVNIGRALLADPPLLILDEPTSGLDYEMIREIYRLLRTMHESGKTVIFTSHRPEEIRSLATRIMVLHQGSLEFDGPPLNIFYPTSMKSCMPDDEKHLHTNLQRSGYCFQEQDATSDPVHPQKAAEGNSPDWITDITSLHQGGIQRETLPTWVLMLVLLIGFIILPAQVAEEKEKKLLLALLQTPINEAEWLIAKVVLGILLIVAAVLFLHVLGSFGPVHLFDYLAVLLAGSFCFSAYGVFLGFLCRNQASARTLGVIFYLPHLLPSAMSDVSQKLTAVAPLLPSYQLYKPLQSILLEDGRLAAMTFDWVYLVLLGSLMFLLSYLLMKKRWLM